MNLLSTAVKRILVLRIDDTAIGALVMERGREGLRVVASTRLAIDSDQAGNAEAVGQALRAHLDAAGIRTRSAVICVPAKWCFSTQTEMPELSEEDARGYIEIHAERALPLPIGELTYAASRYRVPEGGPGVTIIALQLTRLEWLEALLGSAQLTSHGCTLAVTGLGLNGTTEPRAVLYTGPDSVEFAVTIGDGIYQVRTLGGVPGTENANGAEVEELSRQLRYSFHRLPQEVRDRVRRVEFYASSDAPISWLDDFQAQLTGVPVERMGTPAGLQVPGEEVPDPALLSVAAGALQQRPMVPDFLPMKVGRAAQVVETLLKRRGVTIVSAVALLLVVAGAAFWIQGRTLAALAAESNAIAPQADALKALQDKIKEYQPWFDPGADTLVVMKGLASVFPEDGAVWLRSLRIKEGEQVVCAGSARDSQAWLAVLDAIRKAPGVDELAVSNVRGEAPVEFTFSYRWKGGPQK